MMTYSFTFALDAVSKLIDVACRAIHMIWVRVTRVWVWEALIVELVVALFGSSEVSAPPLAFGTAATKGAEST